MLEWKKDGWKALIALAPIMIILTIFTFYPIINTILISFAPDYNHNTAGFFDYGRFGLDAYKFVIKHDDFGQSILNTIIMVAVGVPLSIGISLLISVSLNAIPKIKGFFQTIFFLPYVTNGIAFGLVFATIFSPMPNGLVNTMLGWFGASPVAWTGTMAQVPFWAGIMVISIYAVWSGLAFKILVFSSGLQSIDKQYYQAAQIDGASKWRIFRKITYPLLSPMVFYITITSLIGAFKAYASIVSLYGEGMGNGSFGTFRTVVGYVYFYFGQIDTGLTHNLSRAAAAAVLLFIMILIVTGLQMWYNKRRVHY